MVNNDKAPLLLSICLPRLKHLLFSLVLPAKTNTIMALLLTLKWCFRLVLAPQVQVVR